MILEHVFQRQNTFMFDISIRDPMGAAAKPSGLPLSFVVNGLKGQWGPWPFNFKCCNSLLSGCGSSHWIMSLTLINIEHHACYTNPDCLQIMMIIDACNDRLLFDPLDTKVSSRHGFSFLNMDLVRESPYYWAALLLFLWCLVTNSWRITSHVVFDFLLTRM
jgi:hypothetical protein